MKFFNDGSDEYNLLNSETGNSAPFKVTSLGNQMFIMFTTDGNVGGKGFTGKITFSNKYNHDTVLYLTINIFLDQEFSVNWKYSSTPTSYNTSIDSKTLQLLSSCNLKNIEKTSKCT